MPPSRTIVICCAGLGTRLGLGIPKALIEVAGKPLICHQLEALAHENDIRVVVGYEAEAVIQTVRDINRDVTFVFNRDYRTTNTLRSLALGAQFGGDQILSLDGDLLVHPKDLKAALESEEEFLGVCQRYTEHPVLCNVELEDGRPLVTGFSREGDSPHEWTGLALVASWRLQHGNSHVYQALEAHLPLPAREIECREIDTAADLDMARIWAEPIFR